MMFQRKCKCVCVCVCVCVCALCVCLVCVHVWVRGVLSLCRLRCVCVRPTEGRTEE